jgi:hypothetical protein
MDPTESRGSGELLAKWAEWYPYTPPVGALLRDAHPDVWLRIHSLPGSKRLPSSGFDYAEIQRRHAVLTTEMLGVESCLILLLHTCHGRGSHHVGADAGFGDRGLPKAGMLSSELWDEETGVFAAPMCVYGVVSPAIPGKLNGFIAAASEDRAHGVVLNLASGRVFAPYDGGVDLFFESAVARDLARVRFADWLSPREDGL